MHSLAKQKWVYTALMQALITLYAAPLIIVLFVALIALAILTIRLELRLRRFMQGADGKSLERTMREVLTTHEDRNAYRAELEKTLSVMMQRLSQSARGISTIRYNALAGNTSARQSFATAILNEHGDGVVFSSIHSRDNTRVYAKPVVHFSSEHELSEEEQAAVAEAKARCA